MTKRVQSQMQGSEINFFLKIKRVAMFDIVRNAAIRESLNIESLLREIERSQLEWFGHVNKMSQERHPKQTLCAKVMRRGHLNGHLQDGLITEELGWNRLGLRPSEMQSALLSREVWRVGAAKCNLELFPQQLSKKKLVNEKDASRCFIFKFLLYFVVIFSKTYLIQ